MNYRGACNGIPHPLLEFENVTVVRGNKKILDSITLTIGEGENIAILGPNGAGKSALIKTITREYYPAITGSDYLFRFRGQDRWNIRDLRSSFGMVSNDLGFTFTRDLSGMEVVLSGFFNSVGLFRQSVTPGMLEKAEKILSFLEVGHLRDRNMTEMSSGEARRVLIGRALVHDPKVLVLDEPANSLDLHALHKFRSTLRKIVGTGVSIILVTHSIQDIIPEISRVILMRDGKIYKDGLKADILTDTNISDLFQVPVRIRKDDGYYYATGY